MPKVEVLEKIASPYPYAAWVGENFCVCPWRAKARVEPSSLSHT